MKNISCKRKASKTSLNTALNRACLWHFLGRRNDTGLVPKFHRALEAKSKAGKLQIVCAVDANEYALVMRAGRIEVASPRWSVPVSLAESVTVHRVLEDFADRECVSSWRDCDGLQGWLEMLEDSAA